MKIIEALKKLKNNEEMSSKLFNLAKKIKEESVKHLTGINKQLPEYDLHDISHSEKVLENIQRIIPETKMKKLSNYELFLLYVGSYLHDCAMALPKWEINLLKLTEGYKGLSSLEFEDSIKKDLESPFNFLEALEFIKEYSSDIYGNFNKRKDFIFIEKDEEQFRKDLAERLISYQKYRNEFSDKLKKLKKDKSEKEYLEYSKFIRQCFIRDKHAERVGYYIKNMSKLFKDKLGGPWGGTLAQDLAKICRAHGRNFKFVMGLNEESNYFGEQTANLQFIAMMLRLGDILHFSFDRVSKSLFAEKMINDEESIKHWKAKFQGTHFVFLKENNRIKIKLIAHCDDPHSYYFIQEYLNWVDNEIDNYFDFIHQLKLYKEKEDYIKKYNLPIARKVERKGINSNGFTPASDLSFTLNQRRILDLLMGVGLYKDKYLCLRELYQNALDACRCMLSIYSTEEGIQRKGKIKFGLGETKIKGEKRKYIYCLDNGVGMTKEVIENYFTNIGDSYYNSKEFNRKSVSWDDNFNPTSQFGIGILSCFMLGDRIEVITKPIFDNKTTGKALDFHIDGPHEYFYYTEPKRLDLERIGSHGTLIKLFLKPEEEINCKNINKLELAIYGQNNDGFVEQKNDIYSYWKNNLYKIMMNNVGITNQRVDLIVEFEDGETKSLLPYDFCIDPIDLNLSENEVELLYDNPYISKTKDRHLYEQYLDCKKFIEVILRFPH